MSSLYKQIWDELSVIDVNEHVEKKMNLSYLSWAWAYSTLMKYYPHNSYSFTQTVEADGSVTVECMLTIHQGDEVAMRSMWLPVMDNKNQAIQNPTARQISDNKMRCFVKCIAMFGLGHYIYAGEDLPDGTEKVAPAEAKKPLRGQQKLMLQRYIIDTYQALEDGDGAQLFQLDRELQEDEKDLPIYEALERLLTSDQKKNRAGYIEAARQAGALEVE